MNAYVEDASPSPPPNQDPSLPLLPTTPALTFPPFAGRRSQAINNLSARPALRPLSLRSGRTTNLTRASNMEAALAQMTGQVQSVPCDHCVSGFGPWEGCVVADRFLNGSCANCHYGSEGARCSLRPAATAATVASAVAAAAAAPAAPPRGRTPLPSSRPAAAAAATTAASDRPRRRVAPTPVGPVRSGPASASRTGQLRAPRRTNAERAERIADLFGELSDCFREEAERRREEDGE